MESTRAGSHGGGAIDARAGRARRSRAWCARSTCFRRAGCGCRVSTSRVRRPPVLRALQRAVGRHARRRDGRRRAVDECAGHVVPSDQRARAVRRRPARGRSLSTPCLPRAARASWPVHCSMASLRCGGNRPLNPPEAEAATGPLAGDGGRGARRDSAGAAVGFGRVGRGSTCARRSWCI